MSDPKLLDKGRDAYRRGSWAEAYAALRNVASSAPLEPGDLEILTWAADLTGHLEEAEDLAAQTHHAAIRSGDIALAARAAFWLGFGLLERGEHSRGSGWMARVDRLLAHHRGKYVEEGYLLLSRALQGLEEGDGTQTVSLFKQAEAIAARFEDQDLATLSLTGRGLSDIANGELQRGLSRMDEAMVAVTAGEVAPIVAGIVYCAVIEACHKSFDLRRAQEWTAAFDRWLDLHPDLVPFRGRCILYRAALMQFHGAWREASEDVERAHGWLSRPPPDAALGEALYQRAELHRLRGEFTEAEHDYRDAGDRGRPPDPGQAQLRFAQGRVEAAAASLRRAVGSTTDVSARAILLEAYVEVAIASAGLDAAKSASDELARIADQVGAPLLQAMADRCIGAVRLADGDGPAAIEALRRAMVGWQSLDAPYEVARSRTLLARACREIGDLDTATFELDAARRAFERLGAAPDIRQVDELIDASPTAVVRGLTPRELEVLRLIAAGKTNRAIGSHLVISEKTVARHVSNIFTKLDVSSRAAATAFAFRHDLV